MNQRTKVRLFYYVQYIFIVKKITQKKFVLNPAALAFYTWFCDETDLSSIDLSDMETQTYTHIHTHTHHIFP